MADNYLEKKFEEFYSGTRKSYRPNPKSIDSLLLKNRSCRGYDKSYKVKRIQLERIVSVNSRIASASNKQVLRFRLVTAEDNPEWSEAILSDIRLGGSLPDLHLPFPGTEPEAFIVICTTVPEGKYVDIDMGISAQSMLLKAVDMGLGGIIVCAFDKAFIKQSLSLPYDPIAVIAIGKVAEKCELRTVSAKESLSYYRENGIHVVPKLQLSDIII